MTMRHALLLALAIVLASCDDEPPADSGPDASGSDADADLDADADADVDQDGDVDADGPAPICADPTERFAMPWPGWNSEDTFGPPEGDRAAGVLQARRASWYDQLDRLTGWPSRPTIVVPLWGAASAVDATRVVAYGHFGLPGVATLLETTFSASLVEEGRSLLLRPDRPFAPEVSDVIVVVRQGAVTGASPMAVCGADGEPEPAYAAARVDVPDEAAAELTLPFWLSSVSSELPALAQRIAIEPVLEVAEIRGLTLEEFGDAAPPPEVAALLSDTAAWAILDLPDYRGPDGGFLRGDDGAPEPQGTTSPGVIVVLPEAGAPPYPFVLFQHGGSQNKTDVLQLAGPLAEAGFALVAVDLPYHGDRAEGAGGTDMDIMDFDDPIKTRDNLRQASADHLAILGGVDDLNAALEPVLGVAGALDPSRAFYMGLSLGGLTGSLTFSSRPQVRAGALFVAAADYSQIVTYGLFSVLMLDLLGRPDVEREVALGQLEAFLEPADPLAYAGRREDQTAPPRPLLLMQAVDDPVIAMPASDYWGLLFGAGLAEPFDHEVEGMETLALPAADNFSWAPGGEAATRVLVQAPMAEVPVVDRHGGLIVQAYSQELVAHCFRTFLDDGSCEAIDTGFPEH
jgi:dienelactone hydrolase